MNALAGILVLTIFLVPGISALRIILGIPFILFFPGYALVSALFPRRKDLDGLERLALSLGLSLAVVPLVGLGLNYTPFGIRLYPVTLSLFLFMLGMTAVAQRRRAGLPFEERFRISFSIRVPSWGELTLGNRLLLVGCVLALIGVGIGAPYLASGRHGESFTEFYVLGPRGMMENYPIDLKLGETGTLILGIKNHEYERVAYDVALIFDGEPLGEIRGIELAHGESWEGGLTFTPPKAGENRHDLEVHESIENVAPGEDHYLEIRYRLDNVNDSFRVQVENSSHNWNYRGENLTSTTWMLWRYRLDPSELLGGENVHLKFVDMSKEATAATDLLIDYVRVNTVNVSYTYVATYENLKGTVENFDGQRQANGGYSTLHERTYKIISRKNYLLNGEFTYGSDNWENIVTGSTEVGWNSDAYFLTEGDAATGTGCLYQSFDYHRALPPDNATLRYTWRVMNASDVENVSVRVYLENTTNESILIYEKTGINLETDWESLENNIMDYITARGTYKVFFSCDTRLKDVTLGTPTAEVHWDSLSVEIEYPTLAPMKLEFLLYRVDSLEPYRKLHLWITVWE